MPLPPVKSPLVSSLRRPRASTAQTDEKLQHTPRNRAVAGAYLHALGDDNTPVMAAVRHGSGSPQNRHESSGGSSSFTSSSSSSADDENNNGALPDKPPPLPPKPLPPKAPAAPSKYQHPLFEGMVDGDHVLPVPNLSQERVERRLALADQVEVQEKLKRKQRASAALDEDAQTAAPLPSSSSSYSSPRPPDGEAQEPASGTMSPRTNVVEQAVTHKRQTALMQRLLSGSNCNYSFTEVHTCIWHGLNDSQREQFWIMQCNSASASRIPPFDELIGTARIARNYFDQLMKDLYRTNPEAAHSDPYFINNLYRGLIAHAALRPDIGYTQGLNIIWYQIMSCVSRPQQQLIVAEYITNNVLPLYFDTDLVGASIDALVLRYYLRRRCKNLESLLSQRFGVHDFLLRIAMTWWPTLFVTQINKEQSRRLWDMIMLRGGVALFEFTLRLIIYAQQVGWVDAADTWVDLSNSMSEYLASLQQIDEILCVHLPCGRIVFEDFVMRRRCAARIVFARLAENEHLVDICMSDDENEENNKE